MRYLTIALTLGLLLSANKCNKTPGMADLASMADTKWVLQSLSGKGLELPDGVDTPWIQLDAAASKLSGFGGCNNLFGAFKMQGETLALDDIASTKKYCEGVSPTENALMEALRGAKSFKLDDGVLSLLGDGAKELATFKGQ